MIAEVQKEGGKCHYLLSRFLQHGPLLGQREWGAQHPPPSQEVGGRGKVLPGGSWGGHGQGRRDLGEVKAASSGGSDSCGGPRPTPAAEAGLPGVAFSPALVCTGVGGLRLLLP